MRFSLRTLMVVMLLVGPVLVFPELFVLVGGMVVAISLIGAMLAAYGWLVSTFAPRDTRPKSLND